MLGPNVSKRGLLISSILLLAVASSFGDEYKALFCPKGIKKFSHGTDRSLYYTCSGSFAIPKLERCPDNEHYHMGKQVCMDRVAAEGEIKPRIEKALGRNFELGSLFDARTGMFFPESNLWSKTNLESESTVFKHYARQTEIEVTTVKSTLEKVNDLDISANLAMDFMGGKVKVSGGGGYLGHTSSSDDEAQVNLNFKSVKYARTLNKRTPIDYTKECDNPAFTHVVTSIKYGADVFFVFSRMVEKEETKSTITGNLKLSINFMGSNGSSSGAATGQGEVTMTEEEKKLFESTTLSIYGDISPEYRLPTAFEDAFDFYQQLPGLFGSKEDWYPGAQRVEVNLTPLSEVCGPIEAILNDISDDMTEQMLNMLDELERLYVTVTGLLQTREALKFQPIRTNLNLYKTKLQLFQLMIKSSLMEVLPEIRGGNGAGETELTALLNQYITSPFYYETSSLFLIDRKREIKAVEFLVDNFPEASNIAVADYESANDVQYIFERNEVIVLDFHILSDSNHTQNFLDGNLMINEGDFWYNKVDLNGEVGFKVRSLWSFANDNVDQDERGYMIKLSRFNQETPYNMNMLIKGSLETSNFQIPRFESQPLVQDLSYDSFKLMIPKVNEFVTGLTVYITDVLGGVKHEWNEEVSSSLAAGDMVEVNVGGLKAAHLYSFTVKYLTAVGTSVPSKTIKPFSTRAFSQPQDLKVIQVTRSNITVRWEAPSFKAPEVSWSDLYYEVQVSGSDGYSATFLTFEPSFNLVSESDGYAIVEAEEYSFSVVAVLDRSLLAASLPGAATDNSTLLNEYMDITAESVAAATSCFSLPLPPKLIPVSQSDLSTSTATVTWEPPSKLAPGASITHYELEYTPSNSQGTEDLLTGSTQRLIVPGTQTSVTLEDLYTGGKYKFSLKVLTSAGESEFSSALFFSTLYNEDDLNGVRDSILAEIEVLGERVKAMSSSYGYQDSFSGVGNIGFSTTGTDSWGMAGGAGGSMAANGVFMAQVSGYFKVFLSIQMETDPGKDHSVWVRMNNANLIQYSKLQSTLNNYIQGNIEDNSARSFDIQLNAMDVLTLYHEQDAGTLKNIHFGVVLIAKL